MRYASSEENLRRVLRRKVERACRLRGEDPAELAGLVEDVVRRAVASGLLDDRAYAEARVATLRRRGGSSRAIAARLAAKGVGRELVETALAEDPDETAAARALARRRRLGPWRTADRAAHRDRDLAALARAGFAYGIARAVIDGPAEEAGLADGEDNH